MQVIQFRSLLKTMGEDEIVRKHIVTPDPGPYIDEKSLRDIEALIRGKFQLTVDQRVSAIVVGSAKLGFSFLDKIVDDVLVKPAYRSYIAGRSDMDIAIVSPLVYGKIWSDLASIGAHAHWKLFPNSSKLGRYMYHGWLRPDHFPTPRPQRCSDWDEVFTDLQKYPNLRNKRVRLALYHSQYFLELYQQRGVRLAREKENMI